MKIHSLSRVLVILSLALGTTAGAQETTSPASLYTIPVKPLEAEGVKPVTSLAPYKGKVLLIVNVASKCGYTKQYTGLEALYKKHKDAGLVVVAVPSNDFRNQEPGSAQDIFNFCSENYGVTFPVLGKDHVVGPKKSPLYKYLTEGNHPGKGEVSWNFNKFLIDRKGNVVVRYESKIAPESPELNAAIEKELAKK